MAALNREPSKAFPNKWLGKAKVGNFNITFSLSQFKVTGWAAFVVTDPEAKIVVLCIVTPLLIRPGQLVSPLPLLANIAVEKTVELKLLYLAFLNYKIRVRSLAYE